MGKAFMELFLNSHSLNIILNIPRTSHVQNVRIHTQCSICRWGGGIVKTNRVLYIRNYHYTWCEDNLLLTPTFRQMALANVWSFDRWQANLLCWKLRYWIERRLCEKVEYYARIRCFVYDRSYPLLQHTACSDRIVGYYLYRAGEEVEFPRYWSDPKITAQLFHNSPRHGKTLPPWFDQQISPYFSTFGLLYDGLVDAILPRKGWLNRSTWVLKVSVLETGCARYYSIPACDPRWRSLSQVLSSNKNHHLWYCTYIRPML